MESATTSEKAVAAAAAVMQAMVAGMVVAKAARHSQEALPADAAVKQSATAAAAAAAAAAQVENGLAYSLMGHSRQPLAVCPHGGRRKHELLVLLSQFCRSGPGSCSFAAYAAPLAASGVCCLRMVQLLPDTASWHTQCSVTTLCHTAQQRTGYAARAYKRQEARRCPHRHTQSLPLDFRRCQV
jgi:hypothetical protein